MLITGLPRHSLTKEALAQDEEFATRIVAGRTDEDLRAQGRAAVAISEFTPEVAALYDVVDRLGEVCAGLTQLGGKRPRPVRPVPRPKTALDRVAHENRRKAHRALWERVKPRELTAS